MTETELTKLLTAAYLGNKSAAKTFYLKLLESNVFIPERFQSKNLSDQPEYPNDFFNYLAVKTKEKTVIPCFTDAEFISEWSGLSLEFKEVPYKQLAENLPADWWIFLNPGQEYYKEFSHWEVKKILDKEDGISEIIEEVFMPDDLPSAKLETSSKYPALEKRLTEHVKNIFEIKKLKLVQSKNDSDSLLILVVEIDLAANSNNNIIGPISQIMREELVGDLLFKIETIEKQESLKGKLYQNFPEFYANKKRPLRNYLKGLFSKI